MGYRDGGSSIPPPTIVAYPLLDRKGWVLISICLFAPFCALLLAIFFATKSTTLHCAKSDIGISAANAIGECVVETQYPIGSYEKRYPLRDLDHARVKAYREKNSSQSVYVFVLEAKGRDANGRVQTIEAYSARAASQDEADARKVEFAAFVDDPPKHAFDMAPDRGPPVTLFAVIACSVVIPLAALTLYLLQSAVVTFDWSKRRVTLVRKRMVSRQRLEFPLETLQGAVCEEVVIRTRGGGGSRAARIYLVNREGERAPLLDRWGDRTRAIAVTNRLQTLIEKGPA